MGILRKIKRLFKIKTKRAYVESKPDNPVDATASILRNSASTCRCGSLAFPTEQKGNEYKCIRCHKKIQNTCYNLGFRNRDSSSTASIKIPSQILNMDYYNDAIKLLEKEDKKRR